MSSLELIDPAISTSPLLESLALGEDVESILRAEEAIKKLATDALGTTRRLAIERMNGIDRQLELPMRDGGDQTDLNSGADPLLAHLARGSRTTQTHFKYLLAEGSAYSLYLNLYGFEPTVGSHMLGYRGVGGDTKNRVEFEHTHNRALIVLRAAGSSYGAEERRTTDMPEAVIQDDDIELWEDHRRSLPRRLVEYGMRSVYVMHPDFTHALTLSGRSLSLVVELQEARDFSTSFHQDGSVRMHHDTGKRRLDQMIKWLEAAPDET